jgi:AcrR family transcriptional regulator
VARTRSEQAHQKVLDAAITLFADRGIDSTSMDSIAEQSGVSKATIYKHWPNKDNLALEALGYLFGADVKVPVPDTGDLRADLTWRLSHQPAEDRRVLRERVMPHVIAYAARNLDFGHAWRNRAMSPILTVLTEWIKRERERGTLSAEIELESALAMLVGPLLFRNIFHKREPGQRKVYAPQLEERIADGFLSLYGVSASRRSAVARMMKAAAPKTT